MPLRGIIAAATAALGLLVLENTFTGNGRDLADLCIGNAEL